MAIGQDLVRFQGIWHMAGYSGQDLNVVGSELSLLRHKVTLGAIKLLLSIGMCALCTSAISKNIKVLSEKNAQ